MPDTKPSAFTAATTVAAADGLPIIQGGANRLATATMARGYATNIANGVAGPFATDTYMTGSAVTIPTAGGWKVGGQYYCMFDMVKTAAGTATPIITLRMGTLGTTGDASVIAITFGAGTAAADTGIFELWVNFRTVGAGGAIDYDSRWTHHLAATGITNTGASGTAINTFVASVNMTTQTIIGVSFNGGASFSGTNQLVRASLLNGF